jgi:hypothetical protein
MTGREENLRGGNKFELLYWKVRSRGATGTDAASWSNDRKGGEFKRGKQIRAPLLESEKQRSY